MSPLQWPVLVPVTDMVFTVSVHPLVSPKAGGSSSPFLPWEPDLCSHTLDLFDISTCAPESLGDRGHELQGEAD